jgi:pyrroline-5-carboxylate reductase
MTIELGILGAGNMAEAIAGGIIRAGVLDAGQILAADVSPERRAVFTSKLGIRAAADNREVAASARTLLLSVKPQQMAGVLGGIADVLGHEALIVSIAAGVSTRSIEKHLGEAVGWRVIRTMPNTPMLIGQGIVALARGRNATLDDAQRAWRLFEAGATVIEVGEEQLDAVTAVSGSGPAYIFYLVEQMIRAAEDLGLSPEHSRQLAIRTALGATTMLSSSQEPPAELRRRVTSPGGTTLAALTHLEQHDWAGITVEAIKAAAARSRELGQ